jgi:hypothetical protein
MTGEVPNQIINLEYSGQKRGVRFVETQQVKEGVECDIYTFVDDDTRDLAIVRVQKGSKTPMQLVLRGDETIERYISGTGELRVYSSSDGVKAYPFKDGDGPQDVVVNIGERMQWTADNDSELSFAEVCTPSYQDGRFQDLPE